MTENFEGRVVRGVIWKFASAATMQLSRIVTAVLLARLLSPDDYGVAGMVLVASALVLVFADLAFGAALVQREHLSDADRSTVFWTNALTGAVFTVCGIALSGPIADFYHTPAVKPLFAVFSLTFFVTALSGTQSALLSREMDFRSLELRRMIAYVAGAIVGIAIAATGGGAWAIIIQQLTIAAGSTALLFVATPWRPAFLFSMKSLRSLGGFSARIFVSRILFYLNRNIDNILVGRYLGAAALGMYALAYNVMLMPFSQIASPIQEVLYPAFARMQQEPERIARGWLRVNRMVGAISIPALLGLIVVAPDLIPVLLGGKWEPAVRVVQVLSWVGLLQSLQRMNSSILQARDKTQALLRYSIIVLAASLAAFVGGLHWGVVGVAAGYAISSTIVEPYYTWITLRSIDLKPATFLASLRGVAEAAVVMTAAVYGLRSLLVSAGMPAAPRLVLCILAGAAVYLPLCALRSPELVAEFDGIRRRLRGRRVAVGRAQPVEP
jgi:O-antigen/teichoic acid export membrane protein